MKKTLPLVLIVLSAGLVFSVTISAQQAPLPLGRVSRHSIQSRSCPSGYYAGMTCFKGEVSDCANATNLGFTYGYKKPAQEIVGTIVFLSGAGGTNPYGGSNYAQKYLQSGYEVVYVTWDSDWEFNGNGSGNSIRDAACRPATVLNYLFQNVYTRGGMCAQGDSAGSGAVAYSLAWYGSANYLDNVELLAGPVLGDIEQGCMVPNPSKVTVCPSGQYGCNGAPWTDSPAYVGGDQGMVGKWSGQRSCNGKQSTSPSANQAWKKMSIVDGTSAPSFSYPQTALAGWLCSNIAAAQNNSSAQAQFFYDEFTSFRQAADYSVNRIDNCSGAEGVSAGSTSQGESGFVAISTDMINKCVKRH